MNETALITLWGDVLVSSEEPDGEDALEGAVLEGRNVSCLGLEGNRLIAAPPSIGIVTLRPYVYQLHDAQGRVYSHAPDGMRDHVMEKAEWSELSCLNLRRFPEIAPSTDNFALSRDCCISSATIQQRSTRLSSRISPRSRRSIPAGLFMSGTKRHDFSSSRIIMAGTF
ncbi:hypothetical protein [Asaia platycodi]|uniref:hypothetical protein n=1 Tax=Asaia platycodi TaxID=610243 RepID=UPI00046FF45C|nr:hypothetical protein [Asaia platycodi]